MKRITVIAILAAFILVFNNACQEKPYKQGKILYTNFCANCHMESGEGLGNLIPPLAKSDYLEKHRDDLPCIIRKGLKGAIEVNGKKYEAQEMPENRRLTEPDITNVLNYIATEWGNKGKIWTLDEVRQSLDKCK